MNVKYQIFVSSTYQDLKDEREQIVKATLEMSHVPVGMEMFSAGDETQWKLIQRQINECDYYVVIIAHRYGSIDNGLSYTEKEYDYAVRQGIPVLGFLIDASASWPGDRMEPDAAKKRALDAFKEKAKQRIVSFWTSTDDLYGKYSVALMKAIGSTPRPGWVRATEVAGPEVTAELSRLSSENARLRKQLEQADRQAAGDLAAERSRIVRILKDNTVSVGFCKKGATEFSDYTDVTLYLIFYILAPELSAEGATEDTAALLAVMLSQTADIPHSQLRNYWPIPSNSLKIWLGDLMALGLVAPSKRRHSVTDTKEYWTLTAEGRAVHTMLRRDVLESGAAPLPEPEPESEEPSQAGTKRDPDPKPKSKPGAEAQPKAKAKTTATRRKKSA